MNADQVKASYAAAMDAAGTVVEVRRYTGTGSNRPWSEVTVRARIRTYAARELVGSIREGDQEVIVLDQDLIDLQFPLPVRQGDKVMARGKLLNIEAADGDSRSVGPVRIAWVLQVRG